MNEPGTSSPAGDHVYYQHAGKLKLARRLSAAARRRLFDLFMEKMRPSASERILDVGATDDTGIESNMLEQLYPHRERITCLSLTDGKAILAAYPGVRHVQTQPGRPLPFAPHTFDIVYCNAVLEHVGAREPQKEFIAELCRVAPRRFVAVPNPAFPVEHHTGLPLVHYLPKAWFRKVLGGGRYDYWSREENLNYISAAELRGMWPVNNSPTIAYTGVGFGRWKSNLVIYQA